MALAVAMVASMRSRGSGLQGHSSNKVDEELAELDVEPIGAG
jgi:hypothetical protein